MALLSICLYLLSRSIVALRSIRVNDQVGRVLQRAPRDCSHYDPDAPGPKNAYVTLFYGGDAYFLATRVLGRSIDLSNTKNPKIAIVIPGVSEEEIEQLRADCWLIQYESEIDNPYPNQEKRFYAVLTKLKLWSMTMYDKLVYLDSDTIVLRNIDDVFQCPRFCAAVFHGDHFNTGVMVIKPDMDTYRNMNEGISKTKSYDGTDQGFLNTWFPQLLSSPSLDSAIDSPDGIYRLPSGDHADAAMYHVRGGTWVIPEEEVNVIHYVFGPLRPWKWWTYPILDSFHHWQEIRAGLPNRGGGPPWTVCLAFVVVLGFLAIRHFLWPKTSVLGAIWPKDLHTSSASAKVACLAYVLSAVTSVAVIPTLVLPHIGLWCFLALTLLQLSCWALEGMAVVASRAAGKGRKGAVTSSIPMSWTCHLCWAGALVSYVGLAHFIWFYPTDLVKNQQIRWLVIFLLILVSFVIVCGAFVALFVETHARSCAVKGVAKGVAKGAVRVLNDPFADESQHLEVQWRNRPQYAADSDRPDEAQAGS